MFFLTQMLLSLILDNVRIVNISSALTRSIGAYGAIKRGRGADQMFREGTTPRGNAVNVVAPGAIATDFSRATVRDNLELAQRIAAMTALGRTGVPDDIGR